MANVLNEFLHGVSKGFQDAAFAAFSRRRSTLREDIAQTFGATGEGKPAAEDYLETIDKGKAEAAAAEPKAKRAPRKKGVVDVAPKKRGRRGRPSKGEELREI